GGGRWADGGAGGGGGRGGAGAPRRRGGGAGGGAAPPPRGRGGGPAGAAPRRHAGSRDGELRGGLLLRLGRPPQVFDGGAIEAFGLEQAGGCQQMFLSLTDTTAPGKGIKQHFVHALVEGRQLQ